MNWKKLIIILIQKLYEDIFYYLSSWRPIRLFSICSKIIQKLICKRLFHILAEEQIKTDQQFGFSIFHSTLRQLYWITGFIVLEQKLYATVVFFFCHSGWQQGHFFKPKTILPYTYYLLLQYFLFDRFFSVRQTDLKIDNWKLTQGSISSSIRSAWYLNVLYWLHYYILSILTTYPLRIKH